MVFHLLRGALHHILWCRVHRFYKFYYGILRKIVHPLQQLILRGEILRMKILLTRYQSKLQAKENRCIYVLLHRLYRNTA